MLAAFALLVGSVSAHAEVQVFEHVEWQPPRWAGQEARLDLVDRFAWKRVDLPHLWYRELPFFYTRVWYRMRLQLDHAPRSGQSLYLPRLQVHDLRVYVNRQPIWHMTDIFRPGVPLSAVRIPIPAGLLGSGENTIHLEASGWPRWFHGIPRVYVGDTTALAERAAMRNLIQEQLDIVVASAFGAIGLLALWLWLRAGRDPILFWYGVSGCALLASTVLWYVAIWQPEFHEWRVGLLFMRYHGYLVPVFILHLRIAARRHVWLEAALWLTLVYAFLRISSPQDAGAHSWFGWGLVFSLLPMLLAVPLLITPQLRRRGSVQILIVADIAACLLPLHDWATRLGLFDPDQLQLVYLAPPFVMVAAAVPIVQHMLAGARATEQYKLELEQRVAEKTRELETGYAKLRQAQRDRELAEERRRIMADMHDGLGARLVALLNVAQSGRARHGEISEGIAAALDELRLTVDSVQPVEGDVGVVLGNVRHRMRSVFERAGIRLVWNVSALPRMDDLTPERILAIQRIFLEVFSNAIRHAQAKTVSVFAMRVPGAVRIVIEDDGRGFDPGGPRGGTGLANLQLRARQAGGILAVESRAGDGTRVTLTLPLPEDAEPGLPRTGEEKDIYPVPGISPEPSRA